MGIRDLGYDQITTTEDFNAISLNLDSGCAQGKFGRNLLQAIGNTELTEKVADDARWGPSGKSSKIDCILTGDRLLAEKVQIMNPLASSDHAVVGFDLVLREHLEWDDRRPRMRYNKVDYVEMRKLLSDAGWPFAWVKLSVDEH
ncbi:unnamed protein product [Trichobilharzia regenti]|nr:unnamed protein product [Trichobilharzia regenti]